MADKRTTKPGDSRREDEFYESMPGVMNDYYYRRDEENDNFDEAQSTNQTRHMGREAKTTAIITILLTIVVAIAMGLLFIKGIDLIKNMTPPSGSAGSSQNY